MKKLVSVKEVMIILISLMLVIVSTEVLAVQPDLVLGGGNNNAQTVSPDEYAGAQTPEVENTTNNATNNTTNNNTNNTTNNSTSNNTNNTKVYNTNNTTDLPQTGIEDYNIGILLIICIASAIFAYRKINEYKNI